MRLLTIDRASKAAMNHLSMTLAVEEPSITSIAIRPGVIGEHPLVSYLATMY
jgi:NAD(P)-dependent dehydrogenase (short-subunit alcohol dehydrogenase family)